MMTLLPKRDQPNKCIHLASKTDPLPRALLTMTLLSFGPVYFGVEAGYLVIHLWYNTLQFDCRRLTNGIRSPSQRRHRRNIGANLRGNERPS